LEFLLFYENRKTRRYEKMVMRHRAHPVPPHEREGSWREEPTHGEIMEILERIEELLRK